MATASIDRDGQMAVPKTTKSCFELFQAVQTGALDQAAIVYVLGFSFNGSQATVS